MSRLIAFLTLTMAASPAMAEGPLPVLPAKDQRELLRSADPVLAYNKRLVYDFNRVILVGRHLIQAPKFMRDDYIQHNPNVDTGLVGFIEFFSKLGGPTAIPKEVPDLVSIQAERDIVTFSYV